MNTYKLVQWVIVALGWCSGESWASTITTPQIMAATASARSCMQWKPIGTCFWLRCSLTGCRVRTSLKVGHYHPDLVISVYNEPGGNPWTDIRVTLGRVQKTALSGLMSTLAPIPVGGAGHRTGTATGRYHENLTFREADVVGHPLKTLAGLVPHLGLTCPSQARPLFPYFQSSLDALAWRQEVPEIFYPASHIPGMRELGAGPLQTWGSIYPRTGWTVQTDDPKAAALIAQRAGDITTRTGQPHIYVPVTGTPGSGRIRPPGPLKENDRSTGIWQQLLPRSETTCDVFGSDDRFQSRGWGGGRLDTKGDYVWNLWRPYRCCPRRGQWFLYDLDWSGYPP